MTLGCARCHDHKYDPFTQKEFYQVFAYFNNVPERGKAFKYGNSPPVIPAPTAGAGRDAAGARPETRAMPRGAWPRSMPEIAPAQREMGAIPGGRMHDWAPSRGLIAHLPLAGDLSRRAAARSAAPGKVHRSDGERPRIGGTATGSRHRAFLERRRCRSTPRAGVDTRRAFDGKRYVEAGNVANFGFFDAFTLAAWIYPTAATGAIVSRAQDEPEGQGFALYLKDGNLHASMVQRWLDDGARVESESAVPLNQLVPRHAHLRRHAPGERYPHLSERPTTAAKGRSGRPQPIVRRETAAARRRGAGSGKPLPGLDRGRARLSYGLATGRCGRARAAWNPAGAGGHGSGATLARGRRTNCAGASWNSTRPKPCAAELERACCDFARSANNWYARSRP